MSPKVPNELKLILSGEKNFEPPKKCVHKKNCKIFQKQAERKRILILEQRCFVCLRKGHAANKCHTNISASVVKADTLRFA